MKRIMIADDHDAVRAGIRAIIEERPGWEIVAEARDGKQAIACAIETQPDVAIVDYSMPFMTGIEVARRIKEQKLATEILLFTMHDSMTLEHQAFQVGVRAYLRKSDANKLLLAAIESLMHHRLFYVDENCGVASAAPHGKRNTSHPLSPREATVVKLVAEGYSNKRVSATLNLSIKTTETHRAAAMRKLNINSTAGLVRYAIRNCLVAP